MMSVTSERKSSQYKSSMNEFALCEMLLGVKSAVIWLLHGSWLRTKAQICLTNAQEFSVLWGNI